MITAVHIPTSDFNYINEYDRKLKNLSNLNKLNIFIGENNSGKSRMMRYLINSSDTQVMLDDISQENRKDYNEYLERLESNIKNFNDKSLNSPVIEIEDKVYKKEPTQVYSYIADYIDSLNLDSSIINSYQQSCYYSIQKNLENIFNLLTRVKEKYNSTSINSLDVIYIPILRGIENFDNCYQLDKANLLNSISMDENQRNALNEYKSISKHIYEFKIAKSYSISKGKIFTAENLFDEIVSKLLGEEEGRKFINNFEMFISKEFYDGEGFIIIPQFKKGYLNVKIGNSTERPLHDLGDGIKQLITMLYKIYEKRDKESIFFIEEPELNLHPGYQRKFIEILQNNELFKNHQYFITTHSNHIIDNCFDYNNISIYKFINVKGGNNTFKVINTTNNDVEVLELLGVHNSSVFLSNCTIWVEGISDKILLSKYLSVYMKEKGKEQFKEDIHYAFIEYGGNNIAHWSFMDDGDLDTIHLSSIANKSFIIVDNDNDAQQKKRRKSNLKHIFQENYCELNVREIENTIKRNVLEKTLFDGKEPKYKIKYENMIYADKKTYMGTFIDKHYDLNKKYGNTKTGTIKNKLDFAKKIVLNINSMDDLSPQAKKICKRICAFIDKSNY